MQTISRATPRTRLVSGSNRSPFKKGVIAPDNNAAVLDPSDERRRRAGE
jgi:hypothetical protein